MKLTFSDVLIVPKFSTINSRSEVDLSNSMGQKLPIISSNMKDITESQMASAMASQGAIGALHRFCSIEENVEMFLNSPKETYCSIGLLDFKSFEVLFNEGANNFIIDTANGSCQQAVETCNYIKNLYSSVNLVVGNFDTDVMFSNLLDEPTYTELLNTYTNSINGSLNNINLLINTSI